MGEIFSSFIETFILYTYFKLVLETEPAGRKKQIAGAFVVAALVSSLNILRLDSTIKLIINMGIQTAYAFFCFGGNYFEKIFFGCSFGGIAVLSDQVTFRVASLLPISSLNIVLEPGCVRYELMVVYYLSCIALVSVIVSLKRNRMTLPVRYQLPLVVIIACGLIALDKLLDVIILTDGVEEYSGITDLTSFVCFLLLAVFLSMIYMITRLARLYQERNELQEKQRQEEHALKEYETMRNSVEALRGWKHDFRNHLGIIDSLVRGGKSSEALDYIKKTYGDMEAGTFLVNSGNIVLDSIISSKAMIARNEGIRFSFEIYLENEFVLSPSELTSVLGNILDNAIEANFKLGKEFPRFIEMKVRSRNQMIEIVVENSCDGVYFRDEGKWKSRKDEKHGIGLRQVERIVAKNGGFLTYDPGKVSFKISIMLPAK